MKMDYNNPISGKLIFDALKDKNVIVMAANIRIQHCFRSIIDAAKETDSAVLFEIAKSEIGYTDQQPEEFARVCKEAIKAANANIPYCIHGDHITISENTPAAIAAAEDLIKKEIDAGFTSFAIDASHNFDISAAKTIDQLAANIKITTHLAKLIEKLMKDKGKTRADYSLEVEVGEIGKTDPKTGKQELTTVDEAVTFIKALHENGIYPDLIATNNGTIHGNVYDAEGNVIPLLGIDDKRTREVANAIAPLGVKIAQHGITGTPLELMHKLINAGIAKGNVATHWQDLAIENMPPELVKKMEQWTLDKYRADAKAKKPNMSDKEIVGKNIKNAIKPFKKEIADIDDKYKEKIYKACKASAIEYFEAFNGKGSGKVVRNAIESKK